MEVCDTSTPAEASLSKGALVEAVLWQILNLLTLCFTQTCSRTGLKIFRLGVKSPTRTNMEIQQESRMQNNTSCIHLDISSTRRWEDADTCKTYYNMSDGLRRTRWWREGSFSDCCCCHAATGAAASHWFGASQQKQQLVWDTSSLSSDSLHAQWS